MDVTVTPGPDDSVVLQVEESVVEVVVNETVVDLVVEQVGIQGPPGETGPQGPEGPQGPQGPQGEATPISYVHEEGMPSSSWVIDHPLPYQPMVAVVDSAGSVVEGDVTYDSPGRITLHFSSPFAGKAYLS